MVSRKVARVPLIPPDSDHTQAMTMTPLITVF